MGRKDDSCKSMDGGIPFVRRMSDSMLKEFEGTFREMCKMTSPAEAFIGELF